MSYQITEVMLQVQSSICLQVKGVQSLLPRQKFKCRRFLEVNSINTSLPALADHLSLHAQQCGLFSLHGITLPHFAGIKSWKLNGEFLFRVRVCLGSFVRGFSVCFRGHFFPISKYFTFILPWTVVCCNVH